MKSKKHTNQKRKNRDEKLRRAITLEAAKMMYVEGESQYFTAKRKAARQMGINFRYNPSDLPSNCEIRSEILRQANFYEGEKRKENLKEMRLYALSLMEQLEYFHPKLVGSTLTGHIRKGSDIDMHLFSNTLSLVTQILDNHGFQYHVERKRVIKYNQERIFTHIHVHGRFEVEITMYSNDYLNYRFKSSITGKPMETATTKELKSIIEAEHPQTDIEKETEKYHSEVDTYEMFKLLLLPLESIDGGRYHPEGDTLYHSLQVFELARREGYAYDLEFLQAALLHDVGKAMDMRLHAEIGAEALEGYVSSRTLFLVRHHMDALKMLKGELGHRKIVKLKQSEYFEDLMALRKFDNRGRERGVIVDEVKDVIDYLKDLETSIETGNF